MTEMDRRRFLVLSMVSTLGITLSGCAGFSDDMTLDEILEKIREALSSDDDEDEDVNGPVKLAIRYPAGRSENVFISGWSFGATCSVNGTDMSQNVRWSGTASFSPEIGATTRPTFNSAGSNRLTVSIEVGGKKYEKSINVNAVSSAGYAAIGDKAQCPADAHGCPACPHPTIGPIISGSPNVLINGRPAARVGDRGVHAACCGPNTYEITSAGPDSNVTINGRRAVRLGAETRHCGGTGQVVTAGSG
ncbi:PAAR domain-containing protein [Dehalogenimonas sp. 4OHTPN]|uniref:PAAR domain-containing protein n=1 Tax=Dehalogenimonas sp. 4OHTPN TaxID=3166643 RepID=A0AAU8GCD2_9CHLR